MFRVHHIQRHGVGPFHYFFPQWDLPNSLSSNPNGDRMQKLHTWEFYIPTYHFGVHKTIGILSSWFMYRIQRSERHGVEPFKNCGPWWYLSSNLLGDPNKDCMQKLHPREDNVPTYHFTVHKLFPFHILGSCLGYTITRIIVQDHFNIVLLDDTFPMISWDTQT